MRVERSKQSWRNSEKSATKVNRRRQTNKNRRNVSVGATTFRSRTLARILKPSESRRLQVLLQSLELNSKKRISVFPNYVQTWFMKIPIEPSILYFGTPVVLISTLNEDDSVNVAPMSSAWWLGWNCMLGLETGVTLPKTCCERKSAYLTFLP